MHASCWIYGPVLAQLDNRVLTLAGALQGGKVRVRKKSSLPGDGGLLTVLLNPAGYPLDNRKGKA